MSEGRARIGGRMGLGAYAAMLNVTVATEPGQKAALATFTPPPRHP